MDTFDELCDRLVSHADVLDIIELLEIDGAELIERFEDRAMLNIGKIEEFVANE